MYNINILSFNSKSVTVTYEGFWGVRDTAPPENGNKSAIVEIIIIYLLLFICSKIFISPVYKNAEGQGMQGTVLELTLHWTLSYVIPRLRLEVIENSALLGYYAASSGNFLPTFRDNLSVPSLRVKNPYPCANINYIKQSSTHTHTHS
jgi:hypothetical protein